MARRILAVIALVVAGSASAAVAAAQSPPLTGEVLFCGSNNPRCNAGSVFASEFPCPVGGFASFRYEAMGVTQSIVSGSPEEGPYPGTWAETGTLTSGTLQPFLPFPTQGPELGGQGDVASFSADFTIFSSAGVVTGRKRLLAPGPSPSLTCFLAPIAANLAAAATLCYAARLPDGSIDRGTASLFLIWVSEQAGPFRRNFAEAFQSDPSVGTCGLLPETAAACKQDAWRAFLFFKNQGGCVAWVATGGRNVPG